MKNILIYIAVCSFLLSTCGAPEKENQSTEVNEEKTQILPVLDEIDQEIVQIRENISEGETGITPSAPIDTESHSDTQDTETSTQPRIDPKRFEGRKDTLVKRGDFYLFRNFNDSALESYQIAFNLSGKSDKEIAEKIALILFEQKNFIDANKYFELSMSQLSEESIHKYLKGLSYARDPEILTKVTNLELSEEEYAYQKLIYDCSKLSGACGHLITNYPLEDERINVLRKSLQNYQDTGIEDLLYEKALLMAGFVQNTDYISAIDTGLKILEERPKYQSVMKVVGYGYYEIGDYEKALSKLQEYNKKNNRDSEALYLLGSTYFELEDYTTSNLYFNKALELGFMPRHIIERKLAYNYHILNLPKNMLQVLHYLVNGEGATLDVFTNAIYIALENGDIRRAQNWGKLAAEKFPDSSDIIALNAWIMEINGQTLEAIGALRKAINIDRRNPLAYFRLGVIYLGLQDYKKAQKYFSHTSVLDAGGIFGSQVEPYINQILQHCNTNDCENPTTSLTTNKTENTTES